MAHCVWNLISNGMDHTFWWKWEKTCFAIRNKDATLSNPTTCYIPIIHPGLWQFTKVHNYELQQSKDILWKCLLFPLSFFQITIQSWEPPFWNMNLWEYSNSSLFMCVFSGKTESANLLYLNNQKASIVDCCLTELTIHHKGVFCSLLLREQNWKFCFLFFFFLWGYILGYIKLWLLEIPTCVAVLSHTGPSRDMCALYHLRFLLKSPIVTHPFWLTILHNEGAFIVTTASFDPLCFMPLAGLSWQALPTRRSVCLFGPLLPMLWMMPEQTLCPSVSRSHPWPPTTLPQNLSLE